MFKTKFLVCLFLISFIFPSFANSQVDIDVALDNLTQQINQYMSAQKKTKIAIIPFSDLQKQTTTVLCSYLAEELTTNLFISGKFKILERSLLKQVLDELKLSQTGIVDTNSAKELGKMAGVDAIVTGTIVELGSYIAINCRLIETETGEVFAAAKAKIKKDANVAKIMGDNIGIEKAKETKKKIEEKKEKIFHFKNKTFSLKNGQARLCQVELTFIKIFLDKTIECNLLYKNVSAREISVNIASTPGAQTSSRNTYISDNFGNSYFLLSSRGINNTRRINLPPGITKRVSFTFDRLREGVSTVNLVSSHLCKPVVQSRTTMPYFYSPWRGKDQWVNVIFRNIRIR